MGRGRFSFLLRRALPSLAVLALVAAGCGLLPAALGTPSFAAAALAAPDAWSFADLTLRPSVQQALLARDVYDRYANGAGGPDFGELPTPSGRSVDFEKDVLPHLDEIAYATSGPIDKPHAVVLIHTNDINGILRLLAEEATPKFTTDARGALRYTGSEYTAAGYKNWVVLSNDAPSLEQTLDRIDGRNSPNLGAQQRFKSVVDRLSGDHLAFGYVDLTPVLKSDVVKEARAVDTATARGRMAYSLAFGSGPQAGLRALETQVEFMPDVAVAQSSAPAGDSLAAMDRLPVGNAFAVAGPSLGQVVDSIENADPEDVPEDLLNLLQALAGPYAVGVSPAPLSQALGMASLDFEDSLPASVFFLGRLTADADLDAVQSQTTALLADDADASESYQQQVLVDGDWLAVNVVPSSMDLDQIPQDVLATDQMYQWMRPGFSKEATNVYVNLKSLIDWGQTAGAFSDELAALKPLQAIGGSWRTDPDGAAHGRMQVMIATTP
jgi:hypothetical protein